MLTFPPESLLTITGIRTFIAGLESEMSWATGRPSKSIKLRNDDLHTYITKAYQVFQNWPHNFHQFLDKKSKGDVRFNPRDGKLDTALKEEFGALFKRLYGGDLREPQFGFLREAVAQYLINRLRPQHENRDGASSTPPSNDDKYISVTEVRRLLKISHDSILNLVRTGEIAFTIKNEDSTLRYLLRLADVESVRIRYQQALGSRELAKQPGVDHKVVCRLVQQGHLRRHSRRTIDGYRAPKFDLDTARKLLNT